MQKKVSEFDIQDMLPIGLTLVVLGIGLAYGLEVMGDMREDLIASDSNYGTGCNGTISDGCADAATNATDDAVAGVAKFPEKMEMIATVIIAAIIIGILVRYLMVRFG